jgi:hypothetical protein
VGGSAEASSAYEAGAGIEHRVFDRIPLRAHASVLEDGYRAGGGAGLALGNVRISGAASHVSRPVGDGWLAMLTVALGWD